MSWPDIQENITSCRDGNEISGSNRKVHEINDFFLFQVLMGIPCLAWNQQWLENWRCEPIKSHFTVICLTKWTTIEKKPEAILNLPYECRGGGEGNRLEWKKSSETFLCVSELTAGKMIKVFLTLKDKLWF